MTGRGVAEMIRCHAYKMAFLHHAYKMAENLEDINFPASSVARIIKDAVRLCYYYYYTLKFYFQLPEGVNVSKEAKAAIGRAASIFVLYATSW